MFYHVLLYHVFSTFYQRLLLLHWQFPGKISLWPRCCNTSWSRELSRDMAINKSTTFATDTGNLGWKSSACRGAVGWLESVGMWMWGCDVDHKNGRWEGFLVHVRSESGRYGFWRMFWLPILLEDWKNKHQGDVYIKMFAWIYLTREGIRSFVAGAADGVERGRESWM